MTLARQASTATRPARAAPSPRASWLYEAALCCLLFASYGYFVQSPGPNELSRYDLALALVRDGTTRIDAYEVNTIDKAHVGGSFYTDKAVGTSLLAVPAVAALTRFQRLGAYGDYAASYPIHVATRLAVALPAALAAWALYRMLRRLGTPPADALLAVAALALGSAYAVFATHLYGHSAAAAFGALAAAPVFFRRAGWRGWLLAGGLAGLAVLVEHPAAVVAAALGLLALSRTPRALAAGPAPAGPPARRATVGRLARSPVAAYALGLTLTLLPLPLYGLLSFGSPWAIGYGYVDDPAFAGARQGLFGITLPTLASLGEITVGPTGLLTQSPYLALAAPGFVRWLWRPGRRAEGLVALGVVTAFLYVNASYYLPLGGQGLGPRFLVPALPFLALGLGFAPRWLRWLGLPLAAYSALSALSITAVTPKTGPGHADALRSYWLPRLLAGDVVANWGELRLGLHDLTSLLPLAGLAALAALGLGLAWTTRGRAPALGFAAAALAASLGLTAPLDLRHPGRPPDAFAMRAVSGPAPEQLQVRFAEELEILGYRVESDSLAPGEALRLELYWRALRPLRTRYSFYVHIYGQGDAKLGGFDAVPGDGSYPAEMWPVGAVVRDRYTVRVPASAAAPTALRVRVGVYESGLVRELVPFDRAGRRLETGPVLIRLRLGWPVGPAAAPPAPRARLGESVALPGWELPAGEVRPGEVVAGTLRWRALQRPPADYTVFVQMLPPPGAAGPPGPLAQWDAQPRGGEYPTSLWLPGEEVSDRFSLSIGPDVPPGAYPVIAGLYDLATMRRLPTAGGDHVRLGELVVAPR